MNKAIINSRYYYFFLLILFFVAGAKSNLYSQTDIDGITFQGLIMQNDTSILNQEVELRITFINSLNEISYEEEQIAVTNMLGIIALTIGEGLVTDNSTYESLVSVDWVNTPMKISVSYRLNSNDLYEMLDEKMLNSLVYAFYTPFALGDSVSITQMFDVDQSETPLLGFVIKYRNGNWNYLPEATYAIESNLSEATIYADTAQYALNISLSDTLLDSVSFAYIIDSVSFSSYSQFTEQSVLSGYSDTVQFSHFSKNSLNVVGNEGEVYIGSFDSTSVNLVSTSQIRMSLAPNGHIELGNSQVENGFSLQSNDGFVSEYEPLGVNEDLSVDSVRGLYWKPDKSSFHLGNVLLYTIADSGFYCMSGGLNSKSNSYSFTWGENNKAIGNNVVVFGKNSKATKIGLNSYGTGIAIGKNCIASSRSVALGDRAQCISGSTNIAIGRNIENTGSTSISLGSNIENSALIGGVSIGRYINSGPYYGTFVFADSNTTIINSTNHYRFIAVASGGFKFYTDTLLLNGIELTSGSGSWSSVSSKFSKENSLEISRNALRSLIKDLSVYSWNYKTQNAQIKHIGPLSNDLVDNHIFTISKINDYYGLSSGDMDGLILMGIKLIDEELDKLIIKNSIEEKQIEVSQVLMDLENRIQQIENRNSDE